MRSRTRSARVLLAVSVLLSVAAPGAAIAAPADHTQTAAAEAVTDLTFAVGTAWMDPTQGDSLGRPYFAVPFTFPPYPEGLGVVANSRSTREFGFAAECEFTRFVPAAGEGELTCTLVDDLEPANHELIVNLRSDRSANYQARLFIELCPLTGCSPLFSVAAVQAAAIEVCPGDAFSGSFTYDFNLPWNASGAALGPGAPAGVTLDAGSVLDGGAFSIAGSLTAPGEQSIPIIVTDEFGGEHPTAVTVTVRDAATVACGMLAATGPSPLGPPAAVAALAVLLGGALALHLARRGTVTPPRD
ncbi:hypothetical protein [Microcella sp.]|uniref:hypothetical protein n=1 Tax=Microcella sp. TaxID=1913979 RepID=UPI003F712DCE